MKSGNAIEKCFENSASDNSLDISPQITLSGSAVQRNPDTLGKGTESKENRHGTFRVRVIGAEHEEADGGNDGVTS